MSHSHPSAGDSSDHGELGKLVHAALISAGFRELLLTDAAAALAAGCAGETFRRTPQERELVLSIHASSLQDFAMQLATRRSGEAQDEDHVSHR
jgi:hypothetical protein